MLCVKAEKNEQNLRDCFFWDTLYIKYESPMHSTYINISRYYLDINIHNLKLCLIAGWIV